MDEQRSSSLVLKEVPGVEALTMSAKFSVGDKVKTIKGSAIEGSGEIVEIVKVTSDIQLLWGHNEPHYLLKDMKNNVYISVSERGIEKL